MGSPVSELLSRTAERAPDRVALVDLAGGLRTECCYRALDLGARSVAAHLRSAGLEPGDRVALLLPNGRHFVERWFGIVYAGLTVVPLPLGLATRELRFRIEHARCRALIG